MKLNKIIVFSGTDGSGKTTQIKLLINELKKKGFSTKYLWARGGYTPLFLGLKKILKIFLLKKLIISAEVTIELNCSEINLYLNYGLLCQF